MNRSPRRSLLSMLVPAALAVALAAASVAAEKEPIQARQDAMEAQGAAMKALGAIARKEAPFEAAVVRQNAETIASGLAAVAELFPEGSDRGAIETWARPEIWANRADFDAKRTAAHAAATDLAAVTDEAAFAPALGRVGNACKSCHEKYRRPKE